VFAGRV
jgi:hypothetical protein